MNERYEILSLLDKGGMGEIYLVHDNTLNKKWALKKIPNNISSLKEIDTIKSIDHPAFPRIVDVISEGETLSIVMDFIDGETLSSILEREEKIETEIVVDWAIQIAKALAHLHRHGLLYCDMKPANVMKTADQLVIVDFGTVRELKKEPESDTMSLGTIGYAAPEQFGGKSLVETDIYNLGATIYHLVTGINPAAPPYKVQDITQWGYSSGLNYVIQKACKTNPDDRYHSMDEMIADLKRYKKLESENVHKRIRKIKLLIAFVFVALAFLAFGVFLLETHAPERETAFERIAQIEHDDKFTPKEETNLKHHLPSKITDPKLNLELGKLYLYYYTYGDEGTRMKAALPYFEAAKAKDYVEICTVATQIRKAQVDLSIKPDYVKYLTSLEKLVAKSDKMSEYTQVKLYELTIDFCTANAEYLPEERVEALVDEVYRNLNNSNYKNPKVAQIAMDLSSRLGEVMAALATVFGD
ncbi:MAG: serine/threonine protein kinase [Lactobacillales bacterium]|nr:serine/threonine protein kinase [Lactobacillales bacterium]